MRRNKNPNRKRVVASLLVMTVGINLLFANIPEQLFVKAENIVNQVQSKGDVEDKDNAQDTTSSEHTVDMEEVLNTSIQTTSPAAVELPLNKDNWTKGSDGKYRKIMNFPPLDFESQITGQKEILIKGGQSYPLMPPEGGTLASTTSPDVETEIVDLNNGNKALRVNTTKNASTFIYARFDLQGTQPADSYELRLKYDKKAGTPNMAIKLANDGRFMHGINGDTINYLNEDGVVVGSADGTIAGFRELPPSLTSALSVKGSMTGIKTPKVGLQIWIGPDNNKGNCSIDTLEFVAVTDKNPDQPSVKEERIKTNDIISPKNAGGFELDTEPVVIPSSSTTSDLTATGKVLVVTEGKLKNTKAANISEGAELSIKVADKLLPDTEYSIFFLSKGAKQQGVSLDFRLSGFKNKNKFDYDNGNYNEGDNGKHWEDRDNMFNWIENLNMSGTNAWSQSRYDFTTGKDVKGSVLARFKANNGDFLVDEIYILKRSDTGELTSKNNLPPINEISRGHRILIDQGLQVQTWASTGADIPSIEDIQDMGFTSMQYSGAPGFNKHIFEEAKAAGITDFSWSTAAGPNGKHISSITQDGNDQKGGTPTEDEWENGFLTADNGVDDLKNLISMCMGDEENYSDTMTQNVKNWFEIVREKYDDAEGRTTPILLHHNEVGNTPQGNLKAISTFNLDMLRKYIRTAKPDMISQDMYYFRARRVEQTVGGTVMGFYDDLNRYRIAAGEGLDGTGRQPIPWGQYNYSWRTGPGGGSAFKSGDGWYETTQSQSNLYNFATFAFGGKWMSNFRWLEQNSLYLFNEDTPGSDGTYARYKIYDQFKEMNRQSKNLGPHLVRLLNEDVSVISGQNKSFGDGSIKSNKVPKDNKKWTDIKDTKMNQRVFIDQVHVQNLGTQNNGLNGDVFISYFNQLPNLETKDKQVFTSTDPRYFMILNGLTAGDGLPVELQQGSSYETRQKISITFKGVPEGIKLKKVSRVNKGEEGAVMDVPLVNNQLVTTIGGGLADLYYWECGESKETTTVTANEEGLEELIIGEKKYETIITNKDMGGKTIVIGNITGTEDMQPEANLSKGVNAPDAAMGETNEEGHVLVLNDRPKAMADISSIQARYYRQDLWEFRTTALSKDNNVNLKFKEYNWTKEQLIANVNKVKAGEKVSDMPDIIVVPNEWLWEENNLVSNNTIVSMDSIGSDIINVKEEKWKKSFTQMATQNGKTYGSVTDPYSDAVGLVTNKPLLKSKLGVESVTTKDTTGIYTMQKEEKWTFSELDQIIESAIQKNISSTVKLFVDNDYFIRQLLVSAGVNTDPYAFNGDSEEYREALAIYNKIKTNGLFLESSGTMEGDLKAFSEGKVIFLAASYTEAAKHLTASYMYYEDNLERVTKPVGSWGVQTYGTPKPGYVDKEGNTAYTATVRWADAGIYSMGDTWNFMLFPKKDETSEYKAILNKPSYPVMLSTTANKEDTARILNRLANKYKGTNETDVMGSSRGGEDYPINRKDPILANLTSTNSRDSDSLSKISFGAGCGDNLYASGLYDNILADAIRGNRQDYNKLNTEVESYLKKLGIKDVTFKNK